MTPQPDEKETKALTAADLPAKTPHKVTGLGLASVKTMVEAYAGSIQVASTPDQGTTFHLRLPEIVEGANATTLF